MNKERRNKISRTIKEAETIKKYLEDILREEEYAFDSMPENLQSSMRGEESEEAISCMDEAVDLLNEAIEKLEEIR